ncbi:hypothetical protein AVEN_75899-1 [Araneus ventricosus]|uniref:Uncharacterized protein n=1 Tax=Araneus ventricosus TaxID=182803 RepID=A0A4Y2FS63_ARAVE|nr:hypothetical protein AVEN_75899-1 [Araneus ventricosus]
MRYRTPSLRYKEFQRAQYRLDAELSRAISCQDGRSAEFSFIFRIGLISGSSSCAFWILLKDYLSSVVLVQASTEISVSILNFFQFSNKVRSSQHRVVERGHPFHQRFLCDVVY